MNVIDQNAMEEALAKAQAEYERKGFEFSAHPGAQLLPAFLKGYAPDALARKGQKNVVIGIMPPNPSEQQRKRLSYFADIVKQHRGWDFHLYFAKESRELLDALKEPNQQELLSEIKRARDVAANSEPRAALVYAWGLLEAATRRLVLNERRGASRRYLPSSVIEALVADDYISDEQSAELSRIAGERNLIAHGFTKVDVSKADIDFLLATIESLVSNIPADAI